MSTRIRDKCHGEEEVYCIESLVFPIVVESQGGRHRRPLLHREQLLALQHPPQLVLHDVLVPPQEVLLHLVDGVVHGLPQSLFTSHSNFWLELYLFILKLFPIDFRGLKGLVQAKIQLCSDDVPASKTSTGESRRRRPSGRTATGRPSSRSRVVRATLPAWGPSRLAA